ncbi:MAG: bifunctional riboflavin kinase/FAD synthetase [Chloroflexi bacterium]|nr:bifunctional riboflavin kinase/FAD synthetase [Chloroflexota bacterium]
MRVFHVPDDPPPERPPEVVATIGNFDGVHRGHRLLIGKVIERAAQLGARSAVVTFEPHPRLVLRPDVPLFLMSTLEDKAELFEQLGLDLMIAWPFDATVQQLSAEAFLEQLSRYARLRCLVHGPRFALGRRREGTPDVLADFGKRLGFELEQVQPVGSSATVRLVPPSGGTARGREHEPVLSSSAIRELVQAGQIQRVVQALGRLPTVAGVVVKGEGVGRELGFPTANLQVAPTALVPADGVYAGLAELDPYTPRARKVPAAISIGTRPTFDGTRRVVEAYLLDFAGNLYGQKLRLHLVARLRGQERFASLEALIAQMRRDVETTRALLMDYEGAEVERAMLIAADG